MEKHFEIKITFEQDGRTEAYILFSAKQGTLAPLFDIKLTRAGTNALAGQIAKSVFKMFAKQIRVAIRASGQSQEAKA